MISIFNSISRNVSSFLQQRASGRVGASNTNVVESDGRVWVEVGGSGKSARLKLRVTHLHPDNPALAEAIDKYKSSDGGNDCETHKLNLDEVSLCSQEDFWFNHWEGPAISPSSSEPAAIVSQPLRNSYRRSSLRRSTRRCATCHKKVGVETPASDLSSSDVAGTSSESPVLAHMPSIRRGKLPTAPQVQHNDPSASAVLLDVSSKDSDTASTPGSIGSTEEQLSRVKRVLDHEHRTSYDMFASDMVDGPSISEDSILSLALKNTVMTPSKQHLTVSSSDSNIPDTNLWRSKSCPCSPKAATKSLRRRSSHFSSNDSPHPSPKSMSGSSSKFSLSGSLLAMHKQASASLRAELMKLDQSRLGKVHSRQNSFKNKKGQSSQTSMNEDECSEDESKASTRGSSATVCAKKPIQESRSLPALKLTKVGVGCGQGNTITEEDKDRSIDVDEVPEIDDYFNSESASNRQSSQNSADTSACLQHPTSNESTSSNNPNVIPNFFTQPIEIDNAISYSNSCKVESVGYESQGVLNLGFDGFGESSDYAVVDTNSSSNILNGDDSGKLDDIIQIPGMSLGISHSLGTDVTGFDVPSKNVCIPIVAITASDDTQQSLPDVDSCETSSSPECSAYSTAPSTAQCSPSALRIRVMDGMDKKRGQSSTTAQLQVPNSNNDFLLQLAKRNESNDLVSTAKSGYVTGTLRPRYPTVHTEAGIREAEAKKEEERNSHAEQNESEEERMLMKNMEEARALVYWWEKESDEGQEYCLKEGKCNEKQRPVLFFVHGVGGCADDWHHQLWHFVSAGYEVVAPDMLGHGYSSAPDDVSCYRFPQLLQHLRLLFDLFVPPGRKCVLIGHGYGCALITALSRIHPSSVPLLVLAACGGPFPLLPSTSQSRRQNSSDKSSCSNGCKAALQSITPDCCDGVSLFNMSECWDGITNATSTSLSQAHDGEWWSAFKTAAATLCWLTCCLPCVCVRREAVYQARGKQLGSGALNSPGACATPPYVLKHTLKGQLWSEGDVAFHRRITVPVLLLHGLRDDSVPLVHMCEMEKTIPRAFLEVLGSCGHQLMSDSPADVTSSLHRFLLRWHRVL